MRKIAPIFVFFSEIPSFIPAINAFGFSKLWKSVKKKIAWSQRIIEVLIWIQIGLDPIMGAWDEPTISRLSNNL